MMDIRHEHEAQGNYSRDQFLELTKDALERFYDLTHLENHPFAQKVKRDQDTYEATRGQLLQKDLSRAINMLDSDQIRTSGSSLSRRHHVMRLRYVERLTIQNISYELDISERQIYRDLRQGEEDLATILHSWYVEGRDVAAREDTENAERLNSEIEHLQTDFQTVDIKTLTYSAKSSIERLSANRNVEVVIQAPPEPVMISTDPLVAKHVLISLLSSAVQKSDGGTVVLQLKSSDERTGLSLRYSQPDDCHETMLNDITLQLLSRLKWEIIQEDVEDVTQCIELSFGKNMPTVLVIDDYEALSRLLKRYLAGYRCRIVAAVDGATGLSLAKELQPDAVILDVMMPNMDGWEVLQRLRNHPDTRHIPVFVCSVFDDPELARALGASAFISKPIQREGVIQALRQEHIL